MKSCKLTGISMICRRFLRLEKIFLIFLKILLAFYDKLYYNHTCKKDFTFRDLFYKLYPLLIIYTPLIGKASGSPAGLFSSIKIFV